MRKTKLSKTAAKHTQSWYRNKCVEIAKLIAKHRDEYVCVTCGNSAEQGFQIHGSHILPESKFHRLSCEPLNIMAQCFKCHSLWHEHPKGQDWFEELFPGRKEKLFKMQAGIDCNIIKPDYKKILSDLKEEYKLILQ